MVRLLFLPGLCEFFARVMRDAYGDRSEGFQVDLRKHPEGVWHEIISVNTLGDRERRFFFIERLSMLLPLTSAFDFDIQAACIMPLSLCMLLSALRKR